MIFAFAFFYNLSFRLVITTTNTTCYCCCGVIAGRNLFMCYLEGSHVGDGMSVMCSVWLCLGCLVLFLSARCYCLVAVTDLLCFIVLLLLCSGKFFWYCVFLCVFIVYVYILCLLHLALPTPKLLKPTHLQGSHRNSTTTQWDADSMKNAISAHNIIGESCVLM